MIGPCPSKRKTCLSGCELPFITKVRSVDRGVFDIGLVVVDVQRLELKRDFRRVVERAPDGQSCRVLIAIKA